MVVKDVARNHDDAVAAQFAPAVAQQLDALGLKAYWQRVIAAYGPMRRSEMPNVIGDGEYAFGVHVPVDLARGAILLQLVYVASGQITSLYFLPAQVSDPPSLTPPYVESRATSLVRNLAAGNSGAVVGELNPLSRAAVTPDGLRRGWDNFEAAYGTFISAAPAVVSPVRDDVVDVPIRWAHLNPGRPPTASGIAWGDPAKFARCCDRCARVDMDGAALAEAVRATVVIHLMQRGRHSRSRAATAAIRPHDGDLPTPSDISPLIAGWRSQSSRLRREELHTLAG